jgi:hypothetical protein
LLSSELSQAAHFFFLSTGHITFAAACLNSHHDQIVCLSFNGPLIFLRASFTARLPLFKGSGLWAGDLGQWMGNVEPFYCP